MPTASNATPQEAQNIRSSYANAISATTDALTNFTTNSNPAVTPDPDDQASYQAGALQAQRDLNLLTAQRDAFENDSDLGDIQAPSNTVTQQIAALAATVSAAAAANTAVGDILSNLSQLLTLLNANT